MHRIVLYLNSLGLVSTSNLNQANLIHFMRHRIVEFYCDSTTYKQGLSHKSLKGREILHYLLKTPLPVEPYLACIRAAVLVE